MDFSDRSVFKSYTTRGGCKTSTYSLNKNCDFKKAAIILIPNAIFDNNSSRLERDNE